MPFTQLGLIPELIKGVQAMGYTTPTPIQVQAIPLILQGRDVIGGAQTGTGKTAAFALPILQKLWSRIKDERSNHPPEGYDQGQRGSSRPEAGQHAPGRGPRHARPAEPFRPVRCLILTPTRELAAQVETSVRDLGRFTDIRCAVIYGGVGYTPQEDALRRGVDMLVATPGRLLDHVGRRNVNLKTVEVLVLDEADRMLDMGFMPDIRRILKLVPAREQTLLFSATIPPEIQRLAESALRDAVEVAVAHRYAVAEGITHAAYPIKDNQKMDLIQAILHRIEMDACLIFTRTKHGADKVATALRRKGQSVIPLHSNRTQAQREQALQGFKNGRYQILVATDIASRGLDVEGISHVINYDVPMYPEDYVHRAGRTARASRVGDAITLVTPGEMKYLKAIERFIGQQIPRAMVPEFVYEKFEEPPPAAAPTTVQWRSMTRRRR